MPSKPKRQSILGSYTGDQIQEMVWEVYRIGCILGRPEIVDSAESIIMQVNLPISPKTQERLETVRAFAGPRRFAERFNLDPVEVVVPWLKGLADLPPPVKRKIRQVLKQPSVPKPGRPLTLQGPYADLSKAMGGRNNLLAALGISTTTLHRWIHGLARPTVEHQNKLRGLMKFYGLGVTEF